MEFLSWSQYPAHAARFSFFNIENDEYCLKVCLQAASLVHPNRPLGGFMIARGIGGACRFRRRGPMGDWVSLYSSSGSK